jgi:hypothetical protein
MIQVWDISANNRYVATLKGHTGPVKSICLSKDGRFVVSASEDGSICVWDSVTCTCVCTLPNAHSGDIRGIAMSEDNSVLYSVSMDKSMKQWKVVLPSVALIDADRVTPVAILFEEIEHNNHIHPSLLFPTEEVNISIDSKNSSVALMLEEKFTSYLELLLTTHGQNNIELETIIRIIYQYFMSEVPLIKEHYDRLQTLLHHANKQIKTKDITLAEFEKQTATQQGTLDMVSNQLKQLTRALQISEEALRVRESEIDGLHLDSEKAKAACKEEKEYLQAMIDGTTRRLRDIEQKQSILHKELDDKGKQLDAAIAMKNEHNAARSVLQMEAETNKQKCTQEKAYLQALLDEANNQQRTLKHALEDVNNKLEHQKKELEESNALLKGKMTELDGFRDVAEKIKLMGEEKNSNLQELLNKAYERIKELQLTTAQLHIQHNEVIAQNIELKHQLESEQSQTIELRSNLNNAMLENQKHISQLQRLLDESKHRCAFNENRVKEAQNQHEAERKLRIEVETRLKAEERKNVELQKKCKEVEDRALAEKTSFRQSLESLLKEERAKLEKALEEANAQHRLLEEQLEMERSKFEALRSSVETLEKENKQLRDALVAEEEKNKADKTQTVIDTLGKLHFLINLLYYNKTHANKQRNAF